MSSVLVIRRFDRFSRALSEAGLSVSNVPLIDTVQTENANRLAQKISAGGYDGIFVTSGRAAEILARESAGNEVFEGVVFVLGRSGYEILRDKSLRLSFYEEVNTAAEMMKRIPAEEIDNKRFLFIRGDRSMGAVGEFLAGRASLDEFIVYETLTVSLPAAERERIEAGKFELVCFFSPSGVDGFVENFGEMRLKAIPAAAIGETTAESLRRRGCEPKVIGPKSDSGAFAAAVIEYCKGI